MITFGDCKKKCGTYWTVEDGEGMLIFKDPITDGLQIEFFFSGYGDEAELYQAVGTLPFPNYDERYLKSKLGRGARIYVSDIAQMWENKVTNYYNCVLSMGFNDDNIYGPGIRVYWNRNFSSCRMPNCLWDLFTSIQNALFEGKRAPFNYIKRENI